MAERLQVVTPPVPSIQVAPRRRGLPIAMASGLVAAAVAILVTVVAVTDEDSARRISDVPPGSQPADPATTAPEPSPVTPSPPTPTAPASTLTAPTSNPTSTTAPATSSTIPAPTGIAAITRPLIALPGCATGYARESRPGTTDIRLFSRSSSLPIVMQVIGDPSGSISKPYALIQRYFADQRLSGAANPDLADINGQRAMVIANPDRGSTEWKGSVQWLLADGSEVYIRSRGFDREQLVEIARSLLPRPADAPIAGFDLPSPAPFGLVILDETNEPLRYGGGVMSTCSLVGGGELRAARFSGSIVYRFGIALDWGTLPAVADVDGETSLRVSGPRPQADQALATLRQATPEQWSAMLTAPDPTEVAVLADVPIDAELAEAFAGRTFANSGEASQTFLQYLRDRAAAAGDDFMVFHQMMPTSFGSFVILGSPTGDDSISELLWLVRLTDGGTEVESVHSAVRCRRGDIEPAATAVCT